MGKMKEWWIVGFGVGALTVAMTVVPAFADEGHGKKGHGGHNQEKQDDHGGHYLKHLLKHAEEIGLTPEQIGKLKAIQLDFKRSAARLEADTKVAKLELHALLDDEQTDLKAIQAKVEQLKQSEGACLFEAIKSKRTAMALLTPDQREKDRAHREQMKSAKEGQKGGGMGRMGRGGKGGAGHGGQDGADHESGGSSGGQQHQH